MALAAAFLLVLFSSHLPAVPVVGPDRLRQARRLAAAAAVAAVVVVVMVAVAAAHRRPAFFLFVRVLDLQVRLPAAA